MLPSFDGTLARLGLGADGVPTSPLSGEPDLYRGPSPDVDRLLQMGVETTYRRFLALVSRARRLPPQRVHEIAQGRVWDGGTARQLGLVDRFGSLDDAVAEAARRANLDPDEARIVFLEKQPDFFTQIMRGAAQGRQVAVRDAYSRLASRPEELMARAVADAEALLAGPAIQARCLECPAVGAPVAPRAGGSWLTGLMTLLGLS